MNCDYLQANRYEYLDDTLSPSVKAAVETHLADCATCCAAVQREQQLTQSLAQQFNHAVEPVKLDALARRNLAAAMARATAPVAVRPGLDRLAGQRVNPAIARENKVRPLPGPFPRGEGETVAALGQIGALRVQGFNTRNVRGNLAPARSLGESGKRLPRVWKMPLRVGFWDSLREFFQGNLTWPLATAALVLAGIWAGIHFSGKASLTTARSATPAERPHVEVRLSYSVPDYVFRKDGNQVVDSLTSDTLEADILENN